MIKLTSEQLEKNKNLRAYFLELLNKNLIIYKKMAGGGDKRVKVKYIDKDTFYKGEKITIYDPEVGELETLRIKNKEDFKYEIRYELFVDKLKWCCELEEV